MTGVLHAAIVQIRVSMDAARNLARVEQLMRGLPSGTFAVVPEGALSGYLPERGFVSQIDRAATARGIDTLTALCRSTGLHLVAGACIEEDGHWRNASYIFGPQGQIGRYDKINLATSERGTFSPGHALPVFRSMVAGEPICFGVQMCREIRYPEQWRILAGQGAQLIAYVNNAIGSQTGDALWRAHMISRAAEVQRFVLGANTADAHQTCPSMIVSPAGQILAEVPMGEEAVAVAAISLCEISNQVLEQARTDVVHVSLRDPASRA